MAARQRVRINPTAKRPGVPEPAENLRPNPIPSAMFSRCVGEREKYDGPQGGDWGITIGEWGDAIGAVGIAHALKAPPGMRWLMVGSDAKLAEWLSLQPPFGGPSYLVRSPDLDWYFDKVRRACQTPVGESGNWQQEVLEVAGVRPDRFWETQINYYSWPPLQPRHWRNPVLDPVAVAWAKEVVDSLIATTGRKPVILHPYSNSSNTVRNHWAGWPAGIEWLGEQGLPAILTGRVWPSEWGEVPSTPGIINLIGATPGMQHIYALTQAAGRVVTTSNSLSMWSIIAQIPTVVTTNRFMAQNCPESWFRQWINDPINRFVLFSASQRTWRETVSTLLRDTE